MSDIENPGQLKVHAGGIAWRKQGGGKIIDVDKADIARVTWMKVPRAYQLGVRLKDGLFYKFIGFREQDVSNLTNYIQKNIGLTPEEKQLSVTGHNWGEIDINGNMLTFLVGSKQAFEVSLADVAQTQLQGKTDVYMEFHVDDTTGATEKDSLMDLSFHIPTSNTQFVGDENRPPAQVFLDTIVSLADVGSSEEPFLTFEGIAILTPRGRHSVELHLSFMRLQGLANDFKIQYASIVRLFLLPKFETEYVIEKNLLLSEELLSTRFKDRLEPSYKGLIHEVFIKTLRGISGAKVTRPGSFRSCQDGYAVKSSLKAEDGLLYPLEKGFFFLPKPPTLILHDESRTEKGEEGLVRARDERHVLGGWWRWRIGRAEREKSGRREVERRAKGMKILNLGGSQTTNGVTAALHDDDDDAVDPHLERIKNAAGDESDEEDEDFVAEKDDGGSPTDDSGEEESDATESGEEKKSSIKDSKKEATGVKAPSAKGKSRDGDEEGSKKRKPKRKKDPNAPKRAMSGFMFFSNAERENLKKGNPGMSFTDVGRALGERWKKMTAEEKDPYESMARADTKRYREAMADYKSGGPSTNVDSGASD
ncbi:hypothetical protein MUK42_28561 [Musa troglodytarum]|uniref:FACT complex subunit SSRP1 n=1 Tax=Musa troglodytarum TaxID=320322 RepID=A0A9E7JN16_9LILI|nr:hypothetical protein MUK42_28561 [Musa troglodytarum]